MNIDKQWHKDQIQLYTSEYKIYKIYAETLEKILNRVVNIYTPKSIVQTRVKKISSFAEKAIRKYSKYNNPVMQFTDLCGARVITQTKAEVDIISNFIKTNFIVDETNSLDTSSRLKTNEFGYLSIHYIISLPVGFVQGIPIPDIIENRKAEIQVRTLLQHAWADITHDRLYKSNFIVSENIIRKTARIAATLENADKSFSELTESLDAFGHNYNPYINIEKINNEINTLQIILENEPEEKNKSSFALQLTKMAKILNRWDMIIGTLTPLSSDNNICNTQIKSEILLELGNSLCRKFKNNTLSNEYKKGQKYLKSIAFPKQINSFTTNSDKILHANALSILGWTYENANEPEKARELYLKAYQIDYKNPYILEHCLRYFIQKTDYYPLLKHTLLDAIRTCQSHIDAGIEIPHAYFSIGRFNFLLGKSNKERFYNSLIAYIDAIYYCNYYKVPLLTISNLLNNELQFIKDTNFEKLYHSQYNWIYKTLLLAKTVLTKDLESLSKLKKQSVESHDFTSPVLIVANNFKNNVQIPIDVYKSYLSKALVGFKGTIILNGKNLGFDEFFKETSLTNNIDFGPSEIIQYWINLISSNISTNDIVILGVNESKINILEYKLALALGSRAGLISESNEPATELISNKYYNCSNNLIKIPLDAMSIKTFILYSNSSLVLNENQINKVAKAIHQNYIENAKPSGPSFNSWDDLDESLKNSNRHQAKYFEKIFSSCNYGIRKADGEISYPEFTDDDIQLMSEMEHGRWVIERRINGWEYGREKDIKNKVSPYIVPWSKLPEEIKEYDTDAVKNFCKVLAKVGLEIYKK